MFSPPQTTSSLCADRTCIAGSEQSTIAIVSASKMFAVVSNDAIHVESFPLVVRRFIRYRWVPSEEDTIRDVGAGPPHLSLSGFGTLLITVPVLVSIVVRTSSPARPEPT